ncbi:hypothetical protein JW710_04235 [Candidatus Dojkabacteria bacterium]|nr:hypothetical protein [Candidatus Dojkabacteria bacterium]
MFKSKLFSIFVSHLFILTLLLSIFAPQAFAAKRQLSEGYTIDEYNVTSGGAIYINPSDINTLQFPMTDGDYVVWTDSMAGAGADDDIYYLDISTWTIHNISNEYGLDTAFVGDQRWPSIYNGVIVWMDDANASSNFEIWTLDLNDVTPTPAMISDGNPVSQKMFPHVSANHVVWMQSFTSFDIMLYDLTTTVSTNITSDTTQQLYPKVDGNYVVWQENLVSSDIILYNITTSTETPIVATPNNESWPYINGNSLAWTENDGTSDNIYYIDDVTVPSPTPVAIATSSETEAVPSISGDIIAWTQWNSTDSEWDFYFYDIAEDTTETIDRSADRGAVTVYGNIIVWLDRQDTPSTNYADVHLGFLDWDDSPPVFLNLPGSTRPINLEDDQVVDPGSSYNIRVRPVDDFGISSVRFYFNGQLIGTDTSPDGEGVYNVSWEIPNTCSDIRVEAEDTANNVTTLSRGNICSLLASTGSPIIVPVAAGATLALGGGLALWLPSVISRRPKLVSKIDKED